MLTAQDIYLTPIYLVLFYGLAYAVRARVTNAYTKKYYIPALTVKFVGAIMLGVIYQFYYGGGDTSNYYLHASLVQQAFGDSFTTGLRLLFSTDYNPATAKYVANMFWFSGMAEYTVVRFAAIAGLFCFNTYTVIALIFALLSFSGMWALFITLAKLRPKEYHWLAISVFFLPSVFFWGSGLMKDSLCIGALGWLFYAFYRGAIQRRRVLAMLLVGGLAGYLLFLTKVYILLSFLPPALLWVFNENSQQIKNKTLRVILKPLFLVVGGGVALFAATNLTKGDEKYDIDNIGGRSKITADYLYGVSVATEGSAYKLGEQDGTIGGMVKLAPQAIVVSLFRPFLWEVRNPVMFLSALEALFMLIFTVRILLQSGVVRTLSLIVSTPVLTLCFVFALVFAATVGIVSNNFGTLVRYKIPLMPFYMAGLVITQSMSVTGSKPVGRIRRPARIIS